MREDHTNSLPVKEPYVPTTAEELESLYDEIIAVPLEDDWTQNSE